MHALVKLLLLFFLFSFFNLFSQSINKQVKSITFESYGGLGNGTADDTQAIEAAIEAAKKQALPLELLNGKTYKFTPKNTSTDLTGIPEIRGNGTMDVSDLDTKLPFTIFSISGKIIKIKSNFISSAGDSSIYFFNNTMNLNFIKKNDVLFLVSKEMIENKGNNGKKIRPYYKGQRLTVKKYDVRTKILTTNEKFDFNISDSYLYWNYVRPKFKLGKYIKLITNTIDNTLTGIDVRYADAQISGYLKNFSIAGIQIVSSNCSIDSLIIDLDITKNNGMSYCVSVNDMSKVIFRNCIFSGGRHVIAGGGGMWRLDSCNGLSSLHAAYPSNYVIDGGIYKNTSSALVPDIGKSICAIDAHGVVKSITVKNCTVFGGINLSSNYALIENVTINTDGKRAINIAADTDSDKTDWGNYVIRNVNIITTSNPFSSPIIFYYKVKSTIFENVIICGLDTTISQTRSISLKPPPYAFNYTTINLTTQSAPCNFNLGSHIIEN